MKIKKQEPKQENDYTALLKPVGTRLTAVDLKTNEIMKLKIINRQFDVNWEKVQTLNDMKILLKGLQMQVYLNSETIPEHLEECFEKELLIEQNK